MARWVFGCADSQYHIGITDFGHWRALARTCKNPCIRVRLTKLDLPHIKFYHNKEKYTLTRTSISPDGFIQATKNFRNFSFPGHECLAHDSRSLENSSMRISASIQFLYNIGEYHDPELVKYF